LGNGLIGATWWTSMGWPVAWALIKIVVLVAPLMGAVAYLTLWERKGHRLYPDSHRPQPHRALGPAASRSRTRSS